MRQSTVLLAIAMLLGTGVAHAESPRPEEAPPPQDRPAPLPPSGAPQPLPAAGQPPPGYALAPPSRAPSAAGITLTTLGGIFLVGGAIGFGYGANAVFNPNQQSADDQDDGLTSAFGAVGMLFGGVSMALGLGLLIPGIVILSRDTNPPSRSSITGPVVSWSLAPLTLRPLHGSSANAPGAPAGLAIVGTF